MWHDLKRVAEEKFLDTSAFEKFAMELENVSRYSIYNYQVSSWHVDALVKAYRDQRPNYEAEYDRVAQEQIAKRRAW